MWDWLDYRDCRYYFGWDLKDNFDRSLGSLLFSSLD